MNNNANRLFFHLLLLLFCMLHAPALLAQTENEPVYGKDKIIDDMERSFYSEQVTSLPAGPGTEGKADVAALASGICSIVQKSDVLLAPMPLVIDEKTMKEVAEMDPHKMMRMFVYAPNLVLDYNIYDFSNPNSDPVLTLYAKRLGKDFRTMHPPVAPSTGNPGRDQANYALQLSLFYLANQGQRQKASQEAIVEKVQNTIIKQAATPSKEAGKTKAAATTPATQPQKKTPKLVIPPGN